MKARVKKLDREIMIKESERKILDAEIWELEKIESDVSIPN